MDTLRVAGLVAIGEVVTFMIAFVFFADFCQRLLAALLALSFTFRDAGHNFRNHFRRLIETPTGKKIQPILVKPGEPGKRETPIEEMVVDALVQQGATRKKAQKIVLELRGQGFMTFESLFRMAAAQSTGRTGNQA
jgi:hypothetical protein